MQNVYKNLNVWSCTLGNVIIIGIYWPGILEEGIDPLTNIELKTQIKKLT